jgi:ATP-dependent Clp protease ATP-binding subunit ClpA
MTPLVPKDLVARLNDLSDVLGSNILGQDEVLSDIVCLLQEAFCAPVAGQPIASMLFLGPTGVGKTETALLFTEHLFGSPAKLIRIDLSEFQNQNALGLLVGNNVGERGLFGHYYDRSSSSGTLLFDEIEKAHPLVLDIFLQILSAGRFTLATGETLDLTKYLVVATSNIGSRMLMESRSTDRETLIRRTIQAGTQELRPETFARFDLECIFNKLSFQSLRQVGQLHVVKAVDLLNAQGHHIDVDPSVVEHVQREGYSEKFGARPMQRAALRTLRRIVAAEMLKNGGLPVTGLIKHDRRTNVCSLQPS